MKKKLFAILIAGTMAATVLAGCNPTENGENTNPEIKGVQDMLTVVAGSQIDVLEGVTATDAEDGDLTNKIVVKSTPSLTFTDGKATPEQAGSYELTYSVEDSGKLTAEAYSTLTVTRKTGEATELMKFDFSTKAGESRGWSHNIGEGAEGTAALKQGAYVFDIKNPGGGDGEVQLKKTIELEDADYKVKVWAKSTKETYAHLLARKADVEGWDTYGGGYNLKIGTSVAPIELNFRGEAGKHAELLVNMGKITPNPDNPADTTPTDFTVTVDKVEIYKITGTETERELYKQDFAANADTFTVSTGDDAAANVTHADGKAKLNITSYPKAGEVWNIKADVALGSVKIEKDKKYSYSLEVTATGAQGGELLVESAAGAARANFNGISLAAGETKTITQTFTAESDIDDPVLRFQIGTPSAGVTSNTLTIDNVKFNIVEGDKEVARTNDRFIPYGNGSQNQTTCIYDTFNGTDGDGEGVGTIWTEDGKMYYRMDKIGAVDWHNKLVFGYGDSPLRLPSDSYFTIRFKAKATKDISCAMFLNVIGNWAPRVNTTVNFTTQEQTYEFTTTETLITEMDFELLFQFGSDKYADFGEVTIEFSDFVILQSVVS